jgi:hypothetical protein
LAQRGLRVFLDVEELRTGHFDEALFEVIQETPNFLVILAPNSLDRGVDKKEDWFVKEISHAINMRRNIIPLFVGEFEFPPQGSMPEEIGALRKHNGIKYSHEFFGAVISKIEDNLLKRDSHQERWKILLSIAVALVLIAAVSFGLWNVAAPIPGGQESNVDASSQQKRSLFSSDIKRGRALGEESDGQSKLAQEKHNRKYPSVSLNYVYRTGGSGELKPLTAGSELRSGDHYKVMFSADEELYIYIFQIDSGGQIFQLFPMERFKDVVLGNVNPVRKGKAYTLPSETQAFKLDKQVGTERIYFLAFEEPNQDVERLYAELEQKRKQRLRTDADDLQAKLHRYFKKRGVEEIVTDNPVQVRWDQEVFSIFNRKIRDLCEDCVHVLEFVHQ